MPVRSIIRWGRRWCGVGASRHRGGKAPYRRAELVGWGLGLLVWWAIVFQSVGWAGEPPSALSLELPEPTNLVAPPAGLGRPGLSPSNAPVELDPDPLAGWTQPRPKEVVAHNLQAPTDEPTDPEVETAGWVPLLLVGVGGALLLFLLVLGFLARRANRLRE